MFLFCTFAKKIIAFLCWEDCKIILSELFVPGFASLLPLHSWLIYYYNVPFFKKGHMPLGETYFLSVLQKSPCGILTYLYRARNYRTPKHHVQVWTTDSLKCSFVHSCRNVCFLLAWNQYLCPPDVGHLCFFVYPSIWSLDPPPPGLTVAWGVPFGLLADLWLESVLCIFFPLALNLNWGETVHCCKSCRLTM